MQEIPKPHCRLRGTNGNVFALLGRVTTALKQAQQPEQAAEVATRLSSCQSYDEALRLFMEYVDVT